MKKKMVAILLTGVLVFCAACGSADVMSETLPPLPEIESADIVNNNVTTALEDSNETETEVLEVVEVVDVTADIYAAYNAYQNLATKLAFSTDADNQYEMNFTVNMDMDIDGISFSSGAMDGNIKMIIDDDYVSLAMVMDMSSMGVGMTEMYIDGNDALYIIDGVEIPFEYNMAMEQIDSYVNLPEFEAHAIKSVEIKNVGENVEYTIILDGAMLSDFVLDSLNTMDGLDIDMDIIIDDITMIMLADADEKPLSYSMTMKMVMDIEDSEMTMIANTTYDIVKWGYGVVIDIPSI